MKTLLLVSISLFTVNVMASTSNFNCAAQTSVGRHQHEETCKFSLTGDKTKSIQLCKQQVKAKSNTGNAVDNVKEN